MLQLMSPPLRQEILDNLGLSNRKTSSVSSITQPCTSQDLMINMMWEDSWEEEEDIADQLLLQIPRTVLPRAPGTSLSHDEIFN